MKPFLITAAALLVVLDGVFLLPAGLLDGAGTEAGDYTFAVNAASLALALIVLGFSIAIPSSRAKATATAALMPVPMPPPALSANQAEAEIVAFFGLLQEKGRLIDFLMDDVSSYDDSQVGAAARVVHQGCKEVLREHFKIGPIAQVEEGSRITVPEAHSADEYRLLGKITGNPPFTGILIHKGWKTESVKLPRVLKTDDKRLPSIAPAEVELK